MSDLSDTIEGFGFDPFALCDTLHDAARLALDVAAVASEIQALEELDELPLRAGARELLRRIGGAENLRPYLDTLLAGFLREVAR